MSTNLQRGKLPYRRSTLITSGTPVPPGCGVQLNCTAAGTVNLIMEGGQTLPVICALGTSVLDDYAVVDWTAGTGTAVVYNLYV